MYTEYSVDGMSTPALGVWINAGKHNQTQPKTPASRFPQSRLTLGPIQTKCSETLQASAPSLPSEICLTPACILSFI